MVVDIMIDSLARLSKKKKILKIGLAFSDQKIRQGSC